MPTSTFSYCSVLPRKSVTLSKAFKKEDCPTFKNHKGEILTMAGQYFKLRNKKGKWLGVEGGVLNQSMGDNIDKPSIFSLRADALNLYRGETIKCLKYTLYSPQSTGADTYYERSVHDSSSVTHEEDDTFTINDGSSDLTGLTGDIDFSYFEKRIKGSGTSAAAFWGNLGQQSFAMIGIENPNPRVQVETKQFNGLVEPFAKNGTLFVSNINDGPRSYLLLGDEYSKDKPIGDAAYALVQSSDDQWTCTTGRGTFNQGTLATNSGANDSSLQSKSSLLDNAFSFTDPDNGIEIGSGKTAVQGNIYMHASSAEGSHGKLSEVLVLNGAASTCTYTLFTNKAPVVTDSDTNNAPDVTDSGTNNKGD